MAEARGVVDLIATETTMLARSGQQVGKVRKPVNLDHRTPSQLVFFFREDVFTIPPVDHHRG
jgi:hypothetical protein